MGRILRNPVYIGNTVFHKKEVDEAGSRRTKCLPKEEWKVCENTHEAKDAIIRQAVLAADLKELLRLHNDMVKQQEHQLEEKRVKIQDKLQKYKNENFDLYERYKAGKIGNKEFQDQRLRNLKLQETCQKQIEQYEEKDLDMIGDCFGILPLLEGKENLPEFTKETVKQLVSAIYVYGGDRVEIVFKFKDEMEGILGLINGKAIGYNKIKGGALL